MDHLGSEFAELKEFTRYEKEFRDASILEHQEVSKLVIAVRQRTFVRRSYCAAMHLSGLPFFFVNLDQSGNSKTIREKSSNFLIGKSCIFSAVVNVTILPDFRFYERGLDGLR